MARYYRFSKPVSDEESAEILKEMRDLEDIKMAEITEDRAYLEVETLDDIYSGVMSAAVNAAESHMGVRYPLRSLGYSSQRRRKVPEHYAPGLSFVYEKKNQEETG